MDGDSTGTSGPQYTFRPPESPLVEQIQGLIQIYTDAKVSFFMAAYDTMMSETDRNETVEVNFSTILNVLYTLLEVSKADNRSSLDPICLRQKEIETLRNATQIDEPCVEQIRTLCGWADTTILHPYLKTFPNIAPITTRLRRKAPHTQTVSINSNEDAPPKTGAGEKKEEKTTWTLYSTSTPTCDKVEQNDWNSGSDPPTPDFHQSEEQ
jgi:hypothetical protein